MVKVLLSKLLKYGTLIEKETYWQLLDMQLSGAKYVNVPDGTIEKLEQMKHEQQRKR